MPTITTQSHTVDYVQHLVSLTEEMMQIMALRAILFSLGHTEANKSIQYLDLQAKRIIEATAHAKAQVLGQSYHDHPDPTCRP